MDNLQDRVEEVIEDARWFDGVYHTIDTEKAARAAIRTVIEALAAAAEAEPSVIFEGEVNGWVADWLRGHIDPEAP